LYQLLTFVVTGYQDMFRNSQLSCILYWQLYYIYANCSFQFQRQICLFTKTKIVFHMWRYYKLCTFCQV